MLYKPNLGWEGPEGAPRMAVANGESGFTSRPLDGVPDGTSYRIGRHVYDRDIIDVVHWRYFSNPITSKGHHAR